MQNKYLTEDQAAEILRRTPETLKVWRAQKKGPVFFKDGCGKIWYTEEKLVEFIEGPGDK